ncbi:hypothetical protein JTB14_032099 [Gonioctena quinquepunctata]|nr:hypothetical protein JTB14_032099 [Gonioctena quinquepunctata]
MFSTPLHSNNQLFYARKTLVSQSPATLPLRILLPLNTENDPLALIIPIMIFGHGRTSSGFLGCYCISTFVSSLILDNWMAKMCSTMFLELDRKILDRSGDSGTRKCGENCAPANGDELI